MSDIRKWNGLTGTRIHAGQELRISGGRAPADEAAPKAVAAQTPSGTPTTHRVAKGEFPAKIADRYGVPLDDLLAWNNLSKDAVIVENQELVVYAAKTPGDAPTAVASAAPAAANAPAKTHKAARGDTAGKIAQAHGIKLADFLAWNDMDAKSYVIAGREYVVSQPGGAVQTASRAAASETSAATTHKVKPGQSASTIAKAHGVSTADVLRWNDWTAKTVLRVGQEYVIRADGAAAQADASEKKTIHKVAPGQNPTTIARPCRSATKWSSSTSNPPLKDAPRRDPIVHPRRDAIRAERCTPRCGAPFFDPAVHCGL